jgi:threonine/homoserine/homoserine lactone efflux protein
MFIIQQFTLILMAVIVFISPLMNIYFVVKNVKTQPKRRIVTALGIGLYILFLFLLFMTFLIDT